MIKHATGLLMFVCLLVACDQGVSDDSPNMLDDAVIETDVNASEMSSMVPGDVSPISPDMDVECPVTPGIYPHEVPSTGGAIIEAVGYQPYIGALQDWARVGNHVLTPLYLGPIEEAPGCGEPFLMPPLAAGQYDVFVYYGTPDRLPPEVTAWGTITVVESDESVGDVACEADSECRSDLEVCDLGLGVCVRNLCASLHCSMTWSQGACDAIAGCVPECESDDDCKLIYSDCGCQAVHNSDPRTALTSCALGACEDCGGTNRCVQKSIAAHCDEGVCVEVPL